MLVSRCAAPSSVNSNASSTNKGMWEPLLLGMLAVLNWFWWRTRPLPGCARVKSRVGLVTCFQDEICAERKKSGSIPRAKIPVVSKHFALFQLWCKWVVHMIGILSLETVSICATSHHTPNLQPSRNDQHMAYYGWENNKKPHYLFLLWKFLINQFMVFNKFALLSIPWK